MSNSSLFICKELGLETDPKDGQMKPAFTIAFKGHALPDVILFSEDAANLFSAYLNIGYGLGKADGRTEGLTQRN